MKASGFLREHPSVLNFVLRLLDSAVLCTTGLVLYGMLELIDADFTHYLTAIIVALLLSVIVFPRFELYRPWRGYSRPQEAKMVFLAWITVFLCLTSLSFITKTSEEFSRRWFVLWFTFGLSGVIFFRLVFRSLLSYLRMQGYNQRSIVVIGAGNVGQQVLDNLGNSLETGFDIKAYFTNDTHLSSAAAAKGTSIIGGIDDAYNYLEQNDIDQIWLAMPIADAGRIEAILNNLRNTTADIRLVPDVLGFRLINHSICTIAGLPVVNLSITPMDGINRYVKEVEDRVIAVAILILISPILLLIAVGVKATSPGPVFYRQERVSWNGKVFRMLKFRSMPVDAESETGAVWSSPDDRRATRFGSFLRKTSLDELPQFWNVLIGDMSIVGPRPERPVFVERFKDEIPGYMQKHMVKAGITGWAQVNGWRGDTDLNARIEHDLHYVENWSLWLDIKIIFMTLFKGFRHKNAY